MLMITIAMACNIGGPGAPSGGARNVIMMTYLNDMFGIDIGYFQWIIYCMPFVIIMIPITWFMVNWRFKPQITSLAPAMDQLQNEIDRMGGWNRQQIVALIIFVVMVFGWFTEKTFYDMGICPSAWASASSPWPAPWPTCSPGWSTGATTRRRWTGAWSGSMPGAIIFGRTLDSTGAAYWMARTGHRRRWPRWAWTPACRCWPPPTVSRPSSPT